MAACSARLLITRRLPACALSKLKAASPAIELIYHDDDEPMPRDELMSQVSSGVDGIYCLLSDSIDKAVIDAAGMCVCVLAGDVCATAEIA